VEREYIRSCLRRKERISERARIRLSTIHGAKGGEADHVVLLTDMAPRTYAEWERNPDDEARVWYVATTRARRQLTLIHPATPRHWRIYG
jgi:DNA helicase-2/ATP-dependent DNA helicase PcrA